MQAQICPVLFVVFVLSPLINTGVLTLSEYIRCKLSHIHTLYMRKLSHCQAVCQPQIVNLHRCYFEKNEKISGQGLDNY